MLEDFDLPSEDEPLEERLLKKERTDEIWRLLEKEPELNRRIFLLYYGYDRSQKEIAQALGLGENAVRQRLYRTRNRIRKLLRSDEQERKQL